MRGGARHWKLSALGAGMLGICCASANAAEIHSLQLSTNDAGTRAVFELTGQLDYKLFEIANPDRIVLDLHGSNFSEQFVAPSGKGLLKSVRTGKQGKGDVRVVFDLAASVRPKSFLLPATAKAPCRLVVDLSAKVKTDIVKSAQIAAEKTRD